MTLDDVLPAWDWRSAHATRAAASPERAAAAARSITGSEMLAAIRRRAEA
jgi:acetyl esterase/lipase